jgi:hypothetical protein
MHQYDFVKKTITEAQVQSIINKAKYTVGNYTYTQRVDKDGYLVTGSVVMNVGLLRNAAAALKINKVEISSPPSMEESVDDGTPYQITINMDGDTVTALLNGNYWLYGFKAVQTTQGGGSPLVWFATQDFMAQTQISWEEQYQAFTSQSQIIPGGEITATSPYDITLDQTLTVGAGGVGTVTAGGTQLAISIVNTTDTQFTCGVSELQNGVAMPLCAFPLYGGGGVDVIAPIEKVLLMFSTKPVNTGTVIEQAYSPGILIDLTGENQRIVTFAMNQGWSWGGYSWAQPVNYAAQLVPLLIEPANSSLKKSLIVVS